MFAKWSPSQSTAKPQFLERRFPPLGSTFLQSISSGKAKDLLGEVDENGCVAHKRSNSVCGHLMGAESACNKHLDDLYANVDCDQGRQRRQQQRTAPPELECLVPVNKGRRQSTPCLWKSQLAQTPCQKPAPTDDSSVSIGSAECCSGVALPRLMQATVPVDIELQEKQCVQARQHFLDRLQRKRSRHTLPVEQAGLKDGAPGVLCPSPLVTVNFEIKMPCLLGAPQPLCAPSLSLVHSDSPSQTEQDTEIVAQAPLPTLLEKKENQPPLMMPEVLDKEGTAALNHFLAKRQRARGRAACIAQDVLAESAAGGYPVKVGKSNANGVTPSRDLPAQQAESSPTYETQLPCMLLGAKRHPDLPESSGLVLADDFKLSVSGMNIRSEPPLPRLLGAAPPAALNKLAEEPRPAIAATADELATLARASAQATLEAFRARRARVESRMLATCP